MRCYSSTDRCLRRVWHITGELARGPQVIGGDRLRTLGEFSLSAQAEAPIDGLRLDSDTIENAVEEMIVT